MVEPIQPGGSFTPEARQRWEELPARFQKHVLEVAFCGDCGGAVPMALESAEMRGKELILRGKCKYCGKKVCRVGEGEDE